MDAMRRAMRLLALDVELEAMTLCMSLYCISTVQTLRTRFVLRAALLRHRNEAAAVGSGVTAAVLCILNLEAPQLPAAWRRSECPGSWQQIWTGSLGNCCSALPEPSSPCWSWTRPPLAVVGGWSLCG